jgi:hypothetical protein
MKEARSGVTAETGGVIEMMSRSIKFHMLVVRVVRKPWSV